MIEFIFQVKHKLTSGLSTMICSLGSSNINRVHSWFLEGKTGEGSHVNSRTPAISSRNLNHSGTLTRTLCREPAQSVLCAFHSVSSSCKSGTKSSSVRWEALRTVSNAFSEALRTASNDKDCLRGSKLEESLRSLLNDADGLRGSCGASLRL